MLQAFACVFYKACSTFFSGSHSTAVLCGLMAIAFALVPVGYAVAKKQFPLVFSCIAAFNLAPVWFLYLETVLPGYDAYEYCSPYLRMEAIFWTAVFQTVANGAYSLLWTRGVRFSVGFFSFLGGMRLKPSVYKVVALCVFFLPVLAFSYFYGSFEILWMAATAGRTGGASSGLLIQEPIGNMNSLMLPLNSIWMLTPMFSLIAFIAAKKKASPDTLFVLLTGLSVIFSFFLGGSRGAMMLVASPVLFFIFFYNWQKGFRFWVVAGSLFFLVIGAMEIQERFRGNLLEVLADPEKAAKERGLSSATSFNPAESHRDNNTYLFCLAIKGYPDKYRFEGFNNFFAAIVNPVPRVFWPGKPILLGAKDIAYQQEFITDGPLFMGTTSLTYSIVGEAYKANGFWGVAIYALFYAVFMLFLEGLFFYARRENPVSVGMLGLSAFLVFWGYRAFFALVSFFYPVLILILVLKLFKSFARR